MTVDRAADAATASAFADSWNHLPEGSVYTLGQFVEWFEPVDLEEVRGRDVIELGFGNGSLLYHMAGFGPARLAGVELGDTLETARENLERTGVEPELHRGDLTEVELGEFDLAYCIGVLHHLKVPAKGFDAVVRHTRPGGRFHCWVYAREGNAVVRWLVEPLRRIASRLPWWLTKYGIALPAVVPYYVYAKLMRALDGMGVTSSLLRLLPLYEYSQWIGERGFGFFHHVAFDQLVTPQTVFLSRGDVEALLAHEDVDPESTYIVFRNGNGWKFGGRRK